MTRARGWLAAGVMCALALTSTTAQDKTDSGQKAGDKRFAFTMENQPWNKVLEWLVDQTGLPLVSAHGAPAGAFTFVPPKGAKARTYTLAEIIDYINTGLMTKGLVLLRREAALTLVRADEPLDPQLIPRLKIEDLKWRGGTEIVSVVVPLQTLQAKDILPELKKLLGPFGQVTALRNRILISDTAANLRHVIEILTEVDRDETAAPPARQAPEAASGNVRSFTLEHGNAAMLADELQRLFKSLRDNPVRIVVPAGPGDAPPKKVSKEAKLPGTSPVTLTAVGNRLIVTSDDADALAAINELVRLMTQKTLLGPEVLSLRNASALSVGKLLNETFNGPRDAPRKTERVRIIADPASNTLLVQANALDMITIRRLLKQALDAPDAEAVVRTRLLGPLRHATAADVAKVVNALYANDNVVVAADSKSNTLVLRCSEPVFRDIEQMVRLLDTKEK